MTLQVGLVGFGYAGATIHAPLITSTPGLRLAAVSSRDAARVQAALGADVAVEPSAEALIARDDLDLVVIASPNDTHHPLAAAALRAGRHVVVDKPFALDAAQARELMALARAQGRVLSVFHNRRWDSDFLAARELLRAGSLGRVAHAALHFDRFRPRVRERWRERSGSGGVWMDLAPHLVDIALQLFGTPQAIRADIAGLRDGAQAPDFFDATLHYASGLRVALRANMIAAQAGPRYALHGTRGSYVKYGADTQEDALKAGQRPDPSRPEAWGLDPQPGQVTLATDALDPPTLQTQALPTPRGDWPAYYAQLRDAVHGLKPNPVPAEEALAVMVVLDAGQRSAREGRVIALPEGTS
jgi:predicted dehydrogenase